MSRIVQVSAYYPPHLGGQENAVHDLANALADAGHTVHVFTSTQGGGTSGATQENNVHVHRMSGFVFGHAPIMPTFPAALTRALQRGSVVHLHIGQAFTPEMVWLASKLKRVPYIAELHIDFEPSGPAGILLPLYKRHVLQRVLRAAAAVVVLNKKTLDTVRDAYGYTGDIRILSNGIDEAFFKLQRKPLPATPPPTLQLLFVGRLSKQKNLPTLLQAIARAPYPVHIDVVGDGEDRPIIEQAIKSLGLKNVALHGRLSRSDVMRFYETADALVMPSLYEAQPMVLLEAMAARLPIIGTDVVGVGEHIQDAGIVVPPTPEGLANGIAKYIQHYSSLPAMTAQGYIKAEKSRWRNLLKEYEALYERVA